MKVRWFKSGLFVNKFITGHAVNCDVVNKIFPSSFWVLTIWSWKMCVSLMPRAHFLAAQEEKPLWRNTWRGKEKQCILIRQARCIFFKLANIINNLQYFLIKNVSLRCSLMHRWPDFPKLFWVLLWMLRFMKVGLKIKAIFSTSVLTLIFNWFWVQRPSWRNGKGRQVCFEKELLLFCLALFFHYK